VKWAYLAAPGVSGSGFTATAHLAGFCFGTNTQAPALGIAVGDSGQKIIVGGLQGTGGSVWRGAVEEWTNETTFSAQPVATGGVQWTDLLWLRVFYDGDTPGTNTLLFQLSNTGVGTNTGTAAGTWEDIGSVSASFLASFPAKLGVFVTAQNAGPCRAVLTHWSVTQP
jgi:hypothetical protein